MRRRVSEISSGEGGSIRAARSMHRRRDAGLYSIHMASLHPNILDCEAIQRSVQIGRYFCEYICTCIHPVLTFWQEFPDGPQRRQVVSLLLGPIDYIECHIHVIAWVLCRMQLQMSGLSSSLLVYTRGATQSSICSVGSCARRLDLLQGGSSPPSLKARHPPVAQSLIGGRDHYREGAVDQNLERRCSDLPGTPPSTLSFV